MTIGVIFDLDGVIIDSSALHEESWEKLASEQNLPLVEGHFKKGFGMKNEMIIPKIHQWTNNLNEIRQLSYRKEEIYRELIASRGLTPLPGVLDLLSSLCFINIPCAIGSSTPHLNINVIMQMIKIEHCFDAVVTGDDVIEGKPNPEVFLLASKKIGCEPQHCVVIEDAPVGILAARNAGMKAIGVATTHPVYSLSNADIVVQSLEEIDVNRIRDIF